MLKQAVLTYLSDDKLDNMKTLIFILMIFVSMEITAQINFIAHRGDSYIAPENTVVAAKMAWESGADAVEVDVHVSKDNRIMVIHDHDTKRTCAGKQNHSIAKTPSVLLRDLDAGILKGKEFKGEKIPFLSEVAETVPVGKELVVEIKCGNEIFQPLSFFMEKYGKKCQVVFISFNWDIIVELKRLYPQNKCYWLSSSKNGLDRKIKEAKEAGLEGVNLGAKIIDEEVMKIAEEFKLEVLAWTVDDPAEAKRLTGLGVTKITTNRPKWLKEELGKL